MLGCFGLSIQTREVDLQDEFSKYGQVVKVVVVYDQRVSTRPPYLSAAASKVETERLTWSRRGITSRTDREDSGL